MIYRFLINSNLKNKVARKQQLPSDITLNTELKVKFNNTVSDTLKPVKSIALYPTKNNGKDRELCRKILILLN